MCDNVMVSWHSNSFLQQTHTYFKYVSDTFKWHSFLLGTTANGQTSLWKFKDDNLYMK